jgi:serine/threonine-protein kinase RsbW
VTSTLPELTPVPNTAPVVTVVIPSDLASVQGVIDQISGLLASHPAPPREVMGIQLAMEEALVNAVKHGNQLDPSLTVRVSYRLLPDRFDVAIRDEGPGFDEADVPDPTAPENLDRPCGRGLLLMRHYMTSVRFVGRGNVVRMSRVFGNSATR